MKSERTYKMKDERLKVKGILFFLSIFNLLRGGQREGSAEEAEETARGDRADEQNAQADQER